MEISFEEALVLLTLGATNIYTDGGLRATGSCADIIYYESKAYPGFLHWTHKGDGLKFYVDEEGYEQNV